TGVQTCALPICADLPRDLDAALGGKTSDAMEQRAEVFALDILHGNEMLAVHVADVVHAADVRMRDLPRDAHFADEPRECVRVAADPLREELQCDRLAEEEVVGAIDLAHAAFAEERDDA